VVQKNKVCQQLETLVPFTLNAIKRRASSNSKALIIINQLGGIGRKRSQFLSNADGIRNKKKLRIKYN
jgi:hypothetical protein